MAWCRWATMVLCLAAVVAVQIQWPVPPRPEQLAFQSIPDDRFSLLRRQARQFVEARPQQGFEFVEQRQDATLQIYCRGVPVLWVERRSHYLLLQVSLDARQRAPDVVQLRALLQWQMEPMDYLEQVLAGVPEPVLMDRVRRALVGEVPDGARCGRQ
ncbi:hypothetical protein U0039_12450 [Stenotrophomonas maltophilia]|uniref:hypothetical protein n=1 Tax=Stenotrophomonas maltophilia TaxID=40324 RepID=UPI0004691CD4|nr:hypothetical protein [Stenotrophomonas maltophilia]OMP40223.1 hypothetical protein BMR86_08450 [Stenotrophomonas sp. KAs 5-3]OOD10616.1 hypothetical protein BWP19_16155 [Stenotrophomonas maltophilia]QQA84887.1 hypothetical protein I6I01_11045 [Stenotrophomonas maltophilia]WQE21743.1 hypothetical protein U0039_12450 [Stenotrophomonas maltophilia]HDS1015317.1 hypothetical protein [Stenotrophomonas maltophilia]